jgi:hypothetical protein
MRLSELRICRFRAFNGERLLSSLNPKTLSREFSYPNPKP